MLEEIIPFIKKNPITGLVTNSCSTVNTIPEILASEYQHIWYVFVNQVDMFITAKTINYDIIHPITIVNKKGDFKQNSKLTLSTIECINALLLDPSFDLSVDIVIVNDTSRYNLQTNIFTGIWRRLMNPCVASTPKLLLLLDHNELKMPSEWDIAIIKNIIDAPKITYVDTTPEYLITTLIQNIKEKHQTDSDNLLRNYLVYCPKECVNAVRLRLSGIDKIKAIAIRPNCTDIGIEKILFSNHNGKRNVIVTHDLIHLPDINTVFDSMIYGLRKQTEIGGHITVNDQFGKNIANKRASIGKECYRMCSKETFESLKTQVQPEYRRIDIGPTLLFIINKGINPLTFFKEIFEDASIEKSLDILRKNGMLVNNKVTEIGLFHCNLSLSKYPAVMLYNWLGLDNQKEIFPGIVLSCILQHLESRFYLYPGNRKNMRTVNPSNTDVTTLKFHYETHFARWKVINTPIGMYLNMWDTFAREVKTLKPNKKTLEDWCKKNWIDVDTFQALLSSIITCFDYLENKYKRNIKIGTFNTDALIEIVNPLFASVYKSEYHQAIDKNDNIYTNHQNESLHINKIIHQLQHITHPPYKIVALSKSKEVFDENGNLHNGDIMFYHPLN